MICDKCGREVVIGAWPFCPHEKAHFEVDSFEPRFDEHLSPDGFTYTSNRQKRKFMDANGIAEKENNPHRRSPTARGATGQLLFFDLGKR